MRTVGILARPDLARAGATLQDLVTWLGERGVSVRLEEQTARLLAGGTPGSCTTAPARDVARGSEALIVLGGDGTLLAASHDLEAPIPVLGVNFGSLGFLTEITLTELYPALETLLDGSYRYEERLMLRATIQRGDRSEVMGDVLNDVVVTRAALSRIIHLDVTVDGLFVSAFRADGLIVSSPTGSTAYNLAAGGPILHPSLAAVVLTPICPHMLTNRPLVVSEESVIEVRLRETGKGDVHIALDGQPGLPFTPRDLVRISKSPRSVRLVKSPGRDYYEVLRTKLKWGER
jgi:NAD+ kinase